ncbi:MAG: DUF6155 family protein [Bacteroidales bacterium]|nr:DUF6155 family protein [Bacteroidales bacterium]MCF8455525.1 DUF6155 family protein [Bacteroidales bacterium]
MSKREFKKYISGLTKSQLQEQVFDLYERFREVKQFYDFAFNPKEDKLLEECKFKISREYFPVSTRKPKARRSVAQKYIKQFKTLGVEPSIIADVMLFNIEIAQAYCAEKPVRLDSFYTSMLKSYREALKYMNENGLINSLQPRLDKIVEATIAQDWLNRFAFESAQSEMV